MNWDFLNQIPKDYAALVGAVVAASFGFIGVIATLLWNAWLARRADRRKQEAEREMEFRKLDHERLILRVALRAELCNLSRMISGELEFISKNTFTWIPILDLFGVYRENLNKLGLLSSDEVDAITDAYYSYQERIGYIARHA